jgi:hypothetical protein
MKARELLNELIANERRGDRDNGITGFRKYFVNVLDATKDGYKATKRVWKEYRFNDRQLDNYEETEAIISFTADPANKVQTEELGGRNL